MKQFKLFDKVYDYKLEIDDNINDLFWNYTERPKYIYVDTKTGLAYLPNTHQDYLFPINLSLIGYHSTYLDQDDLQELAISTLEERHIDTDNMYMGLSDVLWNKKTKRHYVSYSDNKIIGWIDLPFKWEGRRYNRYIQFGNYGSSIDPKDYKEYLRYIKEDIERLHSLNNGEWSYCFFKIQTEDDILYTPLFESDYGGEGLNYLIEVLPPMSKIEEPKIGCGVIELYGDKICTYKIIGTKEHSNSMRTYTLYELEDQLTGETHFNDLSSLTKRVPTYFHFYEM